MTANFNTNHEITKMQTKVNRPKIAKETKEAWIFKYISTLVC